MIHQYPSMAYGGINEILAPSVLYQVGKLIEDEGYEAVVYRNTGARGVVSDIDGSEGKKLSPEEQIEVIENAKNATAHHRSVEFTRPTREGNVAPDLQFQFRLVAVACGLGEIGWSKMLLTPEFGPLQHVAFIFTDAELEYDEMYNGEPLCRKCGACVRECPGGCIPDLKSGKTVRVDLDGKICECGGCIRACPGHAIDEVTGKRDDWQCAVYYNGANGLKNPFMPPDAFADFEDRLQIIAGEAKVTPERAREILDNIYFYPPAHHSYQCSICGRACDVDCYCHLEEKGVLTKSFKTKFRRREKWSFSLSDFEIKE